MIHRERCEKKGDLAPKNSELALEKTILALNLEKLARKSVILAFFELFSA